MGVDDGSAAFVAVVVGVDGAGRTHRLGEIADAAQDVVRIDGHPMLSTDEVGMRVDTARRNGSLVVVDDAHLLGSAALAALTEAARGGVRITISRRPTIDRPELAGLDEAVAATGVVETLAPLDDRQTAALITAVTGQAASPQAVTAVREISGGLPAVVAAAATGASTTAEPPGSLLARVQRRLALSSPAAAAVARVAALRLDLADSVTAAAAGIPVGDLPGAMRTLRDSGMLGPDGERMISAIAACVLADLSPAERRRLHHMVASALADAGTDPLSAAAQLRSARATGASAADIYRAAADLLLFTDPEAALSWLDEAVDAGADPATVLAARTEASALLGLSAGGTDLTLAPADRVRYALASGAVEAHNGRTERSVEVLLAAGRPGPTLAVPGLVATGQLERARSVATDEAPTALRRFAEAALALPDPPQSLSLLIEAAEAVERGGLTVVLPDTPHAVGALVAVMVGDAAVAEHLLTRAVAGSVGGPAAVDRHRLLLAWSRLRAGRYDTAVSEMKRLAGAQLDGRTRLIYAAIAAGIARRSGDIAHLRDVWSAAEHALARRTVDLLQVELVEELAVGAARLRQQHRAAPVLDALKGIIDRLGRPRAWWAALHWCRLQVAVGGDDPDATDAAARELTPGDADGRAAVLCPAARCWSDVLHGDVNEDAVLRAADMLAATGLPWEASRLAGQAAIRTPDPALARRLLERARVKAPPEAPAGRAPGGPAGGLSEREMEISRHVLAGRTHREIGALLYISPKTVEHHVARIRTKLNAESRADFLASLRTLLEGEP